MIPITPRQREIFLESARLAGDWYVNTQNTEEHPWGGVHDSADAGRYIYEYFVARQWARGMGVWGQAVAIMALLTLERRCPTEEKRYHKSALLAGNYLKTLQILNPTDEKNHGGFREHTPQTDWSFPRDGATGGMGFCALYRETKSEEYLDRARIFAEWYHRFGSDEKGWPHRMYSFAERKPTRLSDIGAGDWQAGGALLYYWLFKLTGDKRWLDYFRQMVDPLTAMLERGSSPEIHDFHGKSEVTFGNNDFSTIVMIAAYRQYRDERYLSAITDYLHRLWTVEDADGSYPTYAGTQVATIGHLEYLQLCRDEKLDEDIPALEQRILRSALAALREQETSPRDLRAYGGYYGQSSFGVSRDRIHHRSTGYSILMNLRLVGGAENPYYSSYNW
jgi:hypothetical protein